MYTQGMIDSIWNTEYKKLNFVKQPITSSETLEWHRQGYTHSSTTGMMYDNKNPMPNWVGKVGQQFNLKNQTYTIYKMSTLDIMPPHIDHFNRYCELFNIDRVHVRRAIIFLEDWQPGHYFEICKRAIVNWSSGDWVLWEPDAEHAASNIGIKHRYTLQITGHV